MKKQLFYTLIYLLIMSCFGMPRGPDEYCHLNQYTKRIADFKEGSYWIYYCDTLDTYDTISVLDYKQEQEKQPFDSHYNYHDIVQVTLKSTYRECDIIDKLENLNYKLDKYCREYSNCTNTSSHGFYLHVIDNGFDPDNGGLSYYSEGYNLNGEIITDIVCYNNNSIDELIDKYYFAANYGIIRMELVIDSTVTEWNLVDYDVVK